MPKEKERRKGKEVIRRRGESPAVGGVATVGFDSIAENVYADGTCKRLLHSLAPPPGLLDRGDLYWSPSNNYGIGRRAAGAPFFAILHFVFS